MFQWGGLDYSNFPQKIARFPDGNRILGVSCGNRHALVLLEIRGTSPTPVRLLAGHTSVWTFGANSYGQLGRPKNSNGVIMQISKVSELDQEGISQVSAGGWHSLCLSVTGKVFTYGYNHYGQCFQNDIAAFHKPTLVTDLDQSFEVCFVCGGGNDSSLVSSKLRRSTGLTFRARKSSCGWEAQQI